MQDNHHQVSDDFRQTLLSRLTLLFTGGLIVALPALYLLDSPLYLPSFFLLIVFSLLSLNSRLPYSLRTTAVIMLFIALGVLVAISRAEPLGGRLWMVIAASLATVLLGLRAGAITLLFGFALLLVPFFWFQDHAHPNFSNDIKDWGVQIVSGFLPGIIMIYAISFAFERLVETESRIRLVTENAVDIIWSVDLEQQFNFVTPSCRTILGYTPKEMLTMKSSDLVSPATVKLITDELARSIAEGVAANQVLEYEMIRKDGSRIWTENTFRLLTDEKGKVTGISGVTRDVSNRKAAEAARDALESQLQQAQKMESIGQLAGGIAHDFNNLLSIIIGNTELLQRASLTPDDTAERLADIRKASDRASAVSQQLLTFSRNDPVALQPIDINELIRELSSLIERLVPAEVSLRLVLEDGLPAAVCDSTKIEQTLVNLVANARDAAGDGGEITIMTSQHVFDEEKLALNRWAKEGRYIAINVIDNGCGIPNEMQDRIFEPFFTSKSAGEGTGLGLSVIFGIVKQHNGFIHLDSVPDIGSNFAIYLPAANQEVQIRKPAAASAAIDGGNETILLAEDNEGVRKVCVKILTDAGYNVIDCGDGTTGAELFEQHRERIDLLLTDAVMPGMSGADLAAHVRNTAPELPVIMTSGHTGNLTDDYPILQKPYGTEELLGRMRECLNASRTETAA